jgi:putative toxin-antitoxin system antitoxin component (TIGR02293 family)
MAQLQSEQTRKVVALLGGPRVLGRRISDAGELQKAVRQGLPYAALEALVRVLEVHAQELTRLLGVAPRTLARRKVARQLSPSESDRLYRLAYITLFAAEVLGSLDKAKGWLGRSNRALRDAAPISVLDTEIGERQVEELLHRIDHGIHS